MFVKAVVPTGVSGVTAGFVLKISDIHNPMDVYKRFIDHTNFSVKYVNHTYVGSKLLITMMSIEPVQANVRTVEFELTVDPMLTGWASNNVRDMINCLTAFQRVQLDSAVATRDRQAIIRTIEAIGRVDASFAIIVPSKIGNMWVAQLLKM